MRGSEPFLFYPKTLDRLATFCFIDAEDKDCYFVTPDQQSITEAVLGGAELTLRKSLLTTALQQSGGVLFTATEDKNADTTLACLCFSGPAYNPPTEIAIFLADGKTVFAPWATGELKIPSGAQALIPVDRHAQMELMATLFHLQSLPDELSRAVLQSLAGSGAPAATLPVAPTAAEEAPKANHESSTRATPLRKAPAWLVPALAGMVCLLLPLNIFLACLHLTKSTATEKKAADNAAQHSPAAIQPSKDKLQQSLTALNTALKNSKDTRLQGLFNSHIGALGQSASKSPAYPTIEAYMLAKTFHIAKSDKSKPDSVKTDWSHEANAQVEQAMQAALPLPANTFLTIEEIGAVKAVACLENPAAPQFANLDCSKVNFDQTATEIEKLTKQLN